MLYYINYYFGESSHFYFMIILSLLFLILLFLSLLEKQFFLGSLVEVRYVGKIVNSETSSNINSKFELFLHEKMNIALKSTNTNFSTTSKIKRSKIKHHEQEINTRAPAKPLEHISFNRAHKCTRYLLSR